MKRKILIAATLFALAAPAHAVTLRWAAQNDILTLDPHSQNHATTISIMQHCYEPLVRYDKKFQIEPALAASWEQVSPAQWRFKLRQNVKFHDGSDLDANDVVMSYYVQWDASSPLHKGNTGAYDYFSGLWGGFMNAKPAP